MPARPALRARRTKRPRARRGGRRPGRWKRGLTGGLAVALVAVAAFTSCSSPRTERTGSIVWHGCGALECATLSVPLDRAHPGGRRIELSLARHPASGKRIGVLLTNPGGPGASGVDFVQDAVGTFGAPVLAHFDIVSWDPRGVGESAGVECGRDLDAFYAVDRSNADAATTRANVAVAKRFVAACEHDSGSLLPYVSTRASADDMDAIRAAMGERTVSYLGYSYGTYLGALYANRYPKRVRAMVLDGAIDPAEPDAAGAIQQAVGFEHALDAFLTWCHASSKCAFARKGDPQAAFADLTVSLEHETLPAKVKGERRTLGPGEANIGIATALYAGNAPGGWPTLGQALRDAAQGDGSALLELSDVYTGREPGGRYDNETAAFYAISCIDTPAPRSVAAVQRLAARAERAAPYFGASNVWLGLPCTFWPAPPVGRVGPIHAPGAPPILVLGTTDDPATPYASAQALARELASGRLLTHVGEGHTVYGRGDACIDGKVDLYLTALTLPAAGTRCK